MILKCRVCEGDFYVPKYRAKTAKHCSRDCWNKRGQHREAKCKHCGRSGLPMSAKKFCSRDCAFMWRRGENHHQWKGDNASYSAKHKWVNKEFGKPEKCFNCDSLDKLNWANVSNQHRRDRNDWIELCASCHKYFDVNMERRNVIIDRWEKFTGQKAEKLN